MPVDHKEKAFESAIEHHLVTCAGYVKAEQGWFHQERALDPPQFLSFIQESQPKTWERLRKLLAERTEETLLDDLAKAMDTRGSLDVLRHGFKCYGEPIKAAYFRPATRMNPDDLALYQKNRLTVIRQLLFKATSSQALDLTLCLNGIPVVTAELKNPMTGQDVQSAMYSFMSQIIPFQDADLEKLYAFVRLLVPRLPKRGIGPAVVLEDEVALRFYRLQQTSEGSIALAAGERGTVRLNAGASE